MADEKRILAEALNDLTKFNAQISLRGIQAQASIEAGLQIFQEIDQAEKERDALWKENAILRDEKAGLLKEKMLFAEANKVQKEQNEAALAEFYARFETRKIDAKAEADLFVKGQETRKQKAERDADAFVAQQEERRDFAKNDADKMEARRDEIQGALRKMLGDAGAHPA